MWQRSKVVAHPPRPRVFVIREFLEPLQVLARSRVKRITPAFLSCVDSLNFSVAISFIFSSQRREFLAIRRSLLKGVKVIGLVWFFLISLQGFYKEFKLSVNSKIVEEEVGYREIFASCNLT